MEMMIVILIILKSHTYIQTYISNHLIAEIVKTLHVPAKILQQNKDTFISLEYHSGQRGHNNMGG